MNKRVVGTLAGGVLTLTLNRPEKRNAIDTPMAEALADGLERADLDAEVRVLAFRGAGKDFCAGMDLDDLLESADRTPEENAASAARFGALFVRMREIPKPVVAVVQGRCLAGGLGLATACDLVLAHPGATFAYQEILRGFVPAMVVTMLRRAVGEKPAFDLVATGRTLSADEAHRAGLVSRVLSAEHFEYEVEALLSQLATASATALALTKRQFYAVEGRSFAEAIALGARVNALARTTPEFRKAIELFLQR